MNKYNKFLKELTMLCRKHNIQIGVNYQRQCLTLEDSKIAKEHLNCDNIIDSKYILSDEHNNFKLKEIKKYE